MKSDSESDVARESYDFLKVPNQEREIQIFTKLEKNYKGAVKKFLTYIWEHYNSGISYHTTFRPSLDLNTSKFYG